MLLRADAARILVEDFDGERHVCRQLNLDGPVGLDRRVGENLAHTHAGRTEGRVVDLAHVLGRDLDGLFDSDESSRALIGRGLLRIGQRRNAGHGIPGLRFHGIDAIEVIDAADVEDALSQSRQGR